MKKTDFGDFLNNYWIFFSFVPLLKKQPVTQLLLRSFDGKQAFNPTTVAGATEQIFKN